MTMITEVRTPPHGAPHGAGHGAGHGAAGAAAGRGVAGGAPSAPCSPAKPGRHGGRKAHSPPAAPAPHGAPHGAAHGAAPWTEAAVVARLEEAGRALLCLPDRGYSTRLRTSSLDIVREVLDSGMAGGRARPAAPDAATISRMDEALGWIARIPPDRCVLRRIAGSRALICPLTDRPLFPWRRLAAVVGADHKAVQRWHAQAIALIVASLNGR